MRAVLRIDEFDRLLDDIADFHVDRAIRARRDFFRRRVGYDPRERTRDREAVGKGLRLRAGLVRFVPRIDEHDDRLAAGVGERDGPGLCADDAQHRRVGVERQGLGASALGQCQRDRRERAAPGGGERAHGGGGRIGRPPAVALADAHQPVAQHGEARIVRRGERDGAGHLREAARFRGKDARIVAFTRNAAVGRRAVARNDLHPTPHGLQQRGHRATVDVRRARGGRRHFRDARRAHEIGAAREFGDIGFIQLAAIGERGQRLDALVQFQTCHQARIVGAQGELQHIGETFRELVVDRLARTLGIDEEGVRPRRQRHIAFRARPEGDQSVSVDRLIDRGLRILHVLPDALVETGSRHDRREVLQGDASGRQRNALLRAAIGILNQRIETGDQPHDRGIGGERQRTAEGSRPRVRWRSGERLRCAGRHFDDLVTSHRRTVGLHGQRELDGVVRLVGVARDGECQLHGIGALFADDGFRVDARGLAAVPGERLLARRKLQPVGGECRATRAARPFDDARDQACVKAVARPYETRQRGLRDEGLTDQHFAGREAEAVGTAHRLRAQLEHGQRVRQLDPDLGYAIGADLHARQIDRHGREIFSHGNVGLRAPFVEAGVAAGNLFERQNAEGHVARVSRGHRGGAFDDEIGQWIETAFLGQRQHGLIDHPERRLARERRALFVAQPDRRLDLLPRTRLAGRFDLDVDDVLHRLDRHPFGGGDGHGLALIEGRGGIGRALRQTAAHDQEMHGELRHLLLCERRRVATEAIVDVDPVVAPGAGRLFDNGERARFLERRLHNERGGLAGRVGILVRRHRRGLRGRARPGDRRLAADEEVDAHLLAATDLVVGLDLNEIDAGFLRLEGELLRLLRARDLPLDQRVVDRLRHVFRGALAEIAGLQRRDPVALDEAHGHVDARRRIALAVDRDDLRFDGAGLFDVARRLHAERERRRRDDVDDVAHFSVVVAGHRRLDRIAARLRGRFDRRVEGHARGAAGVGAAVALEHGRGFEFRLAREARIRREQESFATRRRPDVRELRRAPFDRALGDEAAREIARDQIDGELPIERNHLRRVEHDLESRETIGFLLEGGGAAGLRAIVGSDFLFAIGLLGCGFRSVAAVLDGNSVLVALLVGALGVLVRLRFRLEPIRFEFRRIVAGRGRGDVELVIEAAEGVDLHRDPPFLIVRPVDDEHAALLRRRQFAGAIVAHIALEVHRLLGPVDWPFRKDMAEVLDERLARLVGARRPG